MTLLENKRVMIACATFETYKIVNPAVDYKVDKIYIVHYVKDGNHDSIYYRFFERICELLREKVDGIEIVDSEELYGQTPVYDFNTMLKVVLNMINRERDKSNSNRVFVNISAGSAEYSAASAVAAMMNDDIAKPFAVNTKEYTVDSSLIEELYFENIDGKSVPVGLAKTTYPPRGFMTYKIHKPNGEMIRALKVVHEMSHDDRGIEGMRSADIIQRMKDAGVWPKKVAVAANQEERTKNKNADSVFFYRTYIMKWIELGWIEQVGKRYRITERGVNDIEMFLYKGLDGQ